MTKYITRDKIADFAEKMWESGLRCELIPDENQIKVWGQGYSKMEYIDVVDKRTYDSLINDIKASLLPKDSGHETNTEEQP